MSTEDGDRLTFGESPLDWTADEDADWLQISGGVGTTPSDLELTIDPTGLAPGKYEGAITIQSGEALNNPVTVSITLELISQFSTYLPLVTR